MLKLKQFKTSFLYIVFEGLSRGGNTFIFLFATTLLSKSGYVNLLSLFSLEILILSVSPLFYTEVLYKLRDDYSKETVNKNISSLTFLYFILLAVLFLIFQNYIYDYYDTTFVIVLSIIVNSCVRIVFQNLSTNNQIDEDHKSAIMDKATPFFLSFLFGLIGFFVMEDRIMYFFVGRTVGFVLAVLFYLKYKKTINKFELCFDIALIKSFFSKSTLLVFKGVMSWLLGYGMLNILKNYYSEDINFDVGLTLNLWTLFLLVANGINSIYIPAYRREYARSESAAKKVYSKTFLTYFVILLLSVIGYFISSLSPVQELLSQFELLKYYSVFHFVLLIFIAQIFQFICTPVFYVKDRYNLMSTLSIITSLISLGLIYGHQILELSSSFSLLYVIVLGYFVRSISLFIYSYFIKNTESLTATQ